MPLEIDPQFVDVDFTKDPRFVFGDHGAGLFRGALCLEDQPFYAEIPEANWIGLAEKLDADNTGMEWLVRWILNQGREGSCVGNMTTQGMQVLDAAEHGIDAVVARSAISCYRQIGSSPNSGAMVSDALDVITRNGQLPLNSPENVARFGADNCAPATGFYSVEPFDRWSATAKQTAAGFRLHESFVIRSIAGIMTALFSGWPVGVGRQGHSILYLRPKVKNGKLGIIYPNSWSEEWGFAAGNLPGGFGMDTMSQIMQSASWAFCFRSLVQR